MTLGRPELERRLGYHPVGPATAPIYELNRAAALVLADLWDQVLPPGREAACALTALQEALLWANAAVACNADPERHELVEVDVATSLDDLLERVEGPSLTRSGPVPPRAGSDRLNRPPIKVRTVDELESVLDDLERRREVAQLDADDVPEATR